MILKIGMRNSAKIFCVALIAAFFTAAATAKPAAGDTAEVRGAIERAFQQLRAGDYEALYQILPSASQRRISRDKFVNALQRTRGMYELQRVEISNVRTSGNLAVADTIVYGRARAPFEAEGKIVARQYLVKENGSWRVTAGDRTTVQPLLAANPELARRFPPRPPRVFIKRDGRWVDATQMARSMKR